MTERQCPICLGKEIGMDMSTYQIDCSRCGKYITSIRFLSLFPQYTALEKRRHLISGLIRELNEKDEIPEVFPRTIDELFNHPLIPSETDFVSKAERILKYLHSMKLPLGKSINFSIKNNLHLAYTKDEEELDAILSYLEDEELITLERDKVHHLLMDTKIKLTAKGWKYFEKSSSIRISANTPATNIASIAELIGDTQIDAIFDPYLDNAGLTTLADLVSLGVQISDTIKLLGSAKIILGKSPRLTISYYEKWLKEMSCANGEIRLTQSSEHRRFFILENGKTLILGPSLNSLEKNEAVNLDTNKKDTEFFKITWDQATPLVLC